MRQRRFEHRQERRLDKDHRVLGVIKHPGDLPRRQSGIDRVADRADSRCGVEDLEVSMRAPGERRYPVSRHDPKPAKGIRKAPDALGDLCISRAMRRPLARPRDEFAIAMHSRRVLEKAGDQQRRVHHQRAHIDPPRVPPSDDLRSRHTLLNGISGLQ